MIKLRGLKKILKPKYHNLRVNINLLLDRFFGNKAYEKFVLVCDSRTGSTLLLNSLGFHPQIEVEGELFKYVKSDDEIEEIWRKIFRSRKRRVKYVGFKLFYFHARTPQDKIWTDLKNDKSIKIIHLKRKNLLRAFLSKKIGLKTKQWTENIKSSQIPVEQKQVIIDPEECLKFFELTRKHEEECEELFKNHDVINITYESFIENIKKEVHHIQNELGVVPFYRKSELKKQNPENIKDLIINYNELKEYFIDTQWNFFFK